jgi:GTP-binding protein
MLARFIMSAARPEQFPPEAEPEVAFLGRSNVGKSTLLNALVDVSGLAFVSSKPGCTQLINFYQVDGGFRFVDLPGYGYAKVPKDIKDEWKGLIEAYLTQRESLQLAVLLLDARRAWMDNDVELREWLESQSRPYVVAVTKFDKLKTQRERHESRKALREGYSGELLECSAVTGKGVREIWQAISKTQTKSAKINP